LGEKKRERWEEEVRGFSQNQYFGKRALSLLEGFWGRDARFEQGTRRLLLR